MTKRSTEVLHMLSILRRGSEIQISCAGQVIGTVTVSRNPMHGQHCNLTLEQTRYDPSLAGELFRLLRREIGMPLKVMAYTTTASPPNAMTATNVPWP